MPLAPGALKVTTADQVPGLSSPPGIARTPHCVESAVAVAGRVTVWELAPSVIVNVQVPFETTALGMIAFAVAWSAVPSQPERVMITSTVFSAAELDALLESTLGLKDSDEESAGVVGVVLTSLVVGVVVGDV